MEDTIYVANILSSDKTFHTKGATCFTHWLGRPEAGTLDQSTLCTETVTLTGQKLNMRSLRMTDRFYFLSFSPQYLWLTPLMTDVGLQSGSWAVRTTERRNKLGFWTSAKAEVSDWLKVYSWSQATRRIWGKNKQRKDHLWFQGNVRSSQFVQRVVYLCTGRPKQNINNEIIDGGKGVKWRCGGKQSRVWVWNL